MNQKDIDDLLTYIDKMERGEGDCCHICKRTHGQLQKEFYSPETDDNFEKAPVYMSYKLKYPICVTCMASIKCNPSFVKKVINTPLDDLFSPNI